MEKEGASVESPAGEPGHIQAGCSRKRHSFGKAQIGGLFPMATAMGRVTSKL